MSITLFGILGLVLCTAATLIIVRILNANGKAVVVVVLVLFVPEVIFGFVSQDIRITGEFSIKFAPCGDQLCPWEH